MKIPTSPLLFTLALSSSTLAYPTPRNAQASPNPEASPLLTSARGTPDARAASGDDGWGMMEREKIPGRSARTFGTKRQTANVNGLLGPGFGQQELGDGTISTVSQTASGLLKGPTTALEGLGLGSVGSTVNSVAGGLLGPNGQNSGIGGLGAGLLGGTNGQGLLGSLTGAASGLPVVGGLVGGATNGNLGGLVNGLPVVGGVVGGLLNGNGVGGLVNGLPVVGGLVGEAGKTLNGLPVVGGAVGGLLGQAAEQTTPNPTAAPVSAQQIAQNANVHLGQDLPAANGAVPSLIASLGGGQYLLSTGQILNLGNLGGLGNTANLGAVSGLPAIGGLGSQVTGGLSGVLGNGANAVSGLRGQASGALGSAQTGLSGLTGSTPLGSAGQYVNLGGQLVPLEQAQQILANAGLNGVGSYASDPAFDDGNTVANSTEPLDEGDRSHQTPAEAFQAADPTAKSTEPDTDTPGSATQSLLAENAGEAMGAVDLKSPDSKSGGTSDPLPWNYDGRLGDAAHSVNNGYQNPYPEYRYASNDDALDLIMEAMGGSKPAATDPVLPSATSSATLKPSDMPTGIAAGEPDAQGGYGTAAKAQKGWEYPSYSGYHSRPAQASSTSPVMTNPVQSTSASAPIPTPTSGEDGGGFQDNGSWDENDTWGDWVSATPSPSPARA